MNWSSKQENTINLINGDLLVSASAGSGKTAVLVERVINLILNYGVNIDEILIITFTNAAAAEMSERILNSIENRINDFNKEILEDQLFLIQNANIQTFHAFCFEVLKNNYYRLNLNSNLKLLRDGSKEVLINECIDEVFSDFYSKNHDGFISLVNKYGGKYSDERLRGFVSSIHNFMETRVNINSFKEDILNTYLVDDDDEVLETSFGKILKEICITECRKFLNYAKVYLKNVDSDTKAYNLILHDIGLCDEFILKLEDGYGEFREFLKSKNFEKLPNKFSETCEGYKEEREKFKKVFEKFKKEIFALRLEVVKEDLKSLYKTIGDLIDLVYEFKKCFDRKKREQNLIDFNDMERLTLKILEDESICEGFREKFKYIFIDEYQDTNYIQEYLIGKIKRDNPFNVFMVGDIKQSIYSFRGAKVDLFYQKYKNFNKVDSIDDKISNENKILLYDNYRSRKEIIDFINFIFKNIMVNEVSDVEYTEEEYLNYMGSYETLKNEKEDYFGEVKVSVVLNDDQNDDEVYDEIDEGECALIIKHIKNLVYGDKEHKIFDKEIGDYRKIEYRDIVILMRNVKSSLKSSLLEEMMIQNDIPVYFDGGENFFDSIEVIVITSLLKVIDNPLNDTDLLTILRSEIFNFRENELVYLRILNKDDFLYNNLKLILTLEREDGTNVNLCEDISLSNDEFKSLFNKCNNFLRKINLYRDKSNLMKVDEFIWYLYMDTNFYFNESIKENGVRAQNNLKLIFNKAKEFRNSNFSGLFGFLEFLKNYKKSGDNILVPKNISKNENVVRIMSIHKSKGLEFPVVILCNCSSKFNMNSSRESLVFHDSLGLSLNYVDYEENKERDNLVKFAIKHKIERNIFSEELRILYVALTRAREKLFIIGTYKSLKNFKSISDLSKCRSYLDFICNAMMAHEKGDYLRENSNMKKFSNSFDDCDVSFEIINLRDLISNDRDDKYEKITFEKLSGGSLKYLNEIEKILNFEYRFKDVINTKANMSVSEILSYRDDESLNVNFKVPEFLDENRKKIYRGNDIGDLYHLFMQKMNIKNDISIEYINFELRRMVSEDIFNDEDLKYLKSEKIFKFFDGNLGRRVLKSLNKNQKIYREFEFLMKHRVEEICKNEDVRIQGIIDLFFFDDDKIILIDYKTDKRILGKEGEIPKRYKEQLSYYKIALEKIFKKEVSEKYIYSFENDVEFRV